MAIQELLDKLQEIKAITLDLPEQEYKIDDERIDRILQICNDTLLEWKMEMRLENVPKL